MNHWQDYPVPPMRHEALFGDRIVRCFAGRPASFHAMFQQSVAARPGAEAVVDGPRRWTYGQCDAQSAQLAAGLGARGTGSSGSACLAAAVTACAVTHTGVWSLEVE